MPYACVLPFQGPGSIHTAQECAAVHEWVEAGMACSVILSVSEQVCLKSFFLIILDKNLSGNNCIMKFESKWRVVFFFFFKE